MKKALTILRSSIKPKIAIPALLLLIVLAICFELSPYFNIKKVDSSQLSSSNISSYDNLMIVAHPDDEVLFGGDHIKKGNYFIVCITSGNNSTRKAEFEKVLKETGCGGVILSYPDKLFCIRSRWTFWKDSISDDIETVINYKNWESIVTHNSEGEYGHIHHKLTHSLVMDIIKESFPDKKSESESNSETHSESNFGTETKIYTFGKYYSKSNIPSDINRLSDESVSQKEKLLGIYESQQKTINKLIHIVPYENWNIE